MRPETSIVRFCLVTLLILGVTAVPFASAQTDDEEENEQLARQMTDKLAEIRDAAGKIAKVEEGESIRIDTKELIDALDWLGARAREIKESDDRALARQAGKLAAAVETAQASARKLASGDTPPKQADIDLQNLVEIGLDTVALISPKT